MTKKSKLPKLPKGAWFYKVRGSYLPATWQGWLTYVPFTAYLVWVLIWGLNSQYSFTQTALIVFPAWIAGVVVMTWIAARKS